MSYGDYSEGADSRYKKLLVDEGPLAIVASITQDEYQGDDHWVVRGEDGRVGYLNIGWGSCSGCDAYEDADYGHGSENRDAEMQKLRDSLVGDVHWEASLAELLLWMDARDWGAASYVKREEIQPLIDAAAKHV